LAEPKARARSQTTSWEEELNSFLSPSATLSNSILISERFGIGWFVVGDIFVLTSRAVAPSIVVSPNCVVSPPM
jgi:hypothetical protein